MPTRGDLASAGKLLEILVGYTNSSSPVLGKDTPDLRICMRVCITRL